MNPRNWSISAEERLRAAIAQTATRQGHTLSAVPVLAQGSSARTGLRQHRDASAREVQPVRHTNAKPDRALQAHATLPARLAASCATTAVLPYVALQQAQHVAPQAADLPHGELLHLKEILDLACPGWSLSNPLFPLQSLSFMATATALLVIVHDRSRSLVRCFLEAMNFQILPEVHEYGR